MIRPEGLESFPLTRSGRYCNDASPNRFRDLDAGGATAAGRAEGDQRLAGSQFGRPKRAVSSHADIGQRSPLLERNMVRQSPQRRSRRRHRFGPRPIAKHPQASAVYNDSLACFESRPIPFNDAGRFLAQDQWRLLSYREITRPNDGIQRLDRRRLDAYKYLINARIRIGQGRDLENFQSTM